MRDLDSLSNGTWLNGERIAEAEAALPAILQLGSPGPEFALVLEEAASAVLDRTLEISPSAPGSASDTAAASAAQEELLSSAVTRARRMRAHGVGGQTMTIMRGVVEQALRQSHRRFQMLGYSLLAALLVVSSLAIWKLTVLRREKATIDTHIKQLEAQVQTANGAADVDQLLLQLGNAIQDQAEALQGMLLYRLGNVSEQRRLRDPGAPFR